jgi:hypothetical protein
MILRGISLLLRGAAIEMYNTFFITLHILILLKFLRRGWYRIKIKVKNRCWYNNNNKMKMI